LPKNSPLDRTKNCHLSLSINFIFFLVAFSGWVRKPWRENAIPTAKYFGSRVNEDWAVQELDQCRRMIQQRIEEIVIEPLVAELSYFVEIAVCIIIAAQTPSPRNAALVNLTTD
jgi:hypothetical protein